MRINRANQETAGMLKFTLWGLLRACALLKAGYCREHINKIVGVVGEWGLWVSGGGVLNRSVTFREDKFE